MTILIRLKCIFKINDTLFTPRCSHSVCMWKNYVVISGGLDRNENIIEDILLLDIKTFEIKRLEIENGYYLPRYDVLKDL